MTATKPNSPIVKPIDFLDFKSLFKATCVVAILVTITLFLNQVFIDIPIGALFVVIFLGTAIIMFCFQIANSTTLSKERERNKVLLEQNGLLVQKVGELEERNGTDTQTLYDTAKRLETKKNEYRTECNELRETLDKQKNQFETIITDLKRNNNEWENECKLQKTEITNLKTKITNLEKTISNDKGFENRALISEDKVKSLEKELTALQKTIEPFSVFWLGDSNDLETLNARKEKSKAITNGLNSRIASLEKKLATV